MNLMVLVTLLLFFTGDTSANTISIGHQLQPKQSQHKLQTLQHIQPQLQKNSQHIMPIQTQQLPQPSTILVAASQDNTVATSSTSANFCSAASSVNTTTVTTASSSVTDGNSNQETSIFIEAMEAILNSHI